MFWNLFKLMGKKLRYERPCERPKPTPNPLPPGITFLQSMQKLDVKDGDIVVIRHPGILKHPTELREAIQETIKKYGFNVHVMVFEEGLEVGVMRKENPFINVTRIKNGILRLSE